MNLINSESHDPFFNLALEEVLLKQRTEEYLLLYVNDPSVIIGKHQVAHREVNTKFVTENSIPVIRRISGGGTVFHDRGNLNFSFISNSEEGKQVDFRKYTRPVIEFLIYHGAEAKFEGKNDIRINGLKISGNAEHVHRNRVLHHGTLLFSSSISALKSSIREDKSCYTGRAVDSNPSHVVNLNEILKMFRDINEFRKGLMLHFSNLTENAISEISRADENEACTLAETKYRTWEWNFAYGPDYVFRNAFRFEGKLNECLLHINNGLVLKCEIDGSYRMQQVASKLIGLRHMVRDFLDVFEEENLTNSGEEVFNFF